MLKCFWQFQSFQSLHLEFCNFVKENGSFGHIKNEGIMILRNKKGNSVDYNKKRKITKINKDSNLGLGKVWVNRFMAVLSDKVIPRSQFLCRNDVNIVDELRDLRNINLHLQGLDGKELDGSLLSIDFKNMLFGVCPVMEKLKIPVKFVEWFKAMYDKLGISIVINGWQSDAILNERGVMEGHSASMQVYCLASGPLLKALDSKLGGIRTWDSINHKTKSFADDLKLGLQDPKEVFCVEETIQRFEKVSGLILHRDVSRKKCNVISWGSHRNFSQWPPWVNKCSKTRIIGAVFSNNEDIELLNSMELQRCTLSKIYGSLGLRGTLLQKVYFLNIFVFSKLTYLAQVFRVKEEVLKLVMRESLRFLYRGELERPVNAINYRPKDFLGLGLVHLPSKCKSLLLRTMLKEFNFKGIKLQNGNFDEFLYGLKDELLKLLELGGGEVPTAKDLYLNFVKTVYSRGEVLIPSRMEKKYEGVNWKRAFKNYKESKFLKPKQKEFLFRFIHDILHLGSRNHFRGADQECRREEIQGTKCRSLETREHFFKNCVCIYDVFCTVKAIVESVLKKKVDDKCFFTVSFRCKDQRVNVVVVWFLVQVLEKMYYSSITDPVLVLEEVVKEIDWLQWIYSAKYSDPFETLKMEIQMHILSFKYDM